MESEILKFKKTLAGKVLYYYAEMGAIKVKRNEFIFLKVEILKDIAEISWPVM